MNKDAFYFPHFSNARQDRKLRRLRKQLGIEGYGIYFMILEVLREQPDFSYPFDDIDLLADEFGTSNQKIEVVVTQYDLFEIDKDRMIFSQRFVEYLEPYLKEKERRRIGGIKGNLIKYNHIAKHQIDEMTNDEILAFNERIKQNLATDSLPTRSTSQRKEKKRKEKERKVKEIRYIPTIEEVILYFQKNNYPKDLAEKAYHYYNTSIESTPNAKYWKDAKSNPIKNWKMKMQSVWFKEENRNYNKPGQADLGFTKIGGTF